MRMERIRQDSGKRRKSLICMRISRILTSRQSFNWSVRPCPFAAPSCSSTSFEFRPYINYSHSPLNGLHPSLTGTLCALHLKLEECARSRVHDRFRRRRVLEFASARDHGIDWRGASSNFTDACARVYAMVTQNFVHVW